MKIGFVLDDGLDSSDGVQQYVTGLGDWLQRKGHQVHYLVGETSPSDRMNVHVLSKNLRVRYNANRLSTPLPSSKSRIKSLLNREKFDILHIQVPYSPFMAAQVIRCAPEDTKVVGTFHILPYGRLQQVGVRTWGRMLKKNARAIDKMLAVSAPAAQLCKASLGITPVVIGNHVNLAKYKTVKKRTQNEINIVFLGRLVERKGVIHLLCAIKLLASENMVTKAFNVHIGGDGPLAKKVTRFIKDNGLNKLVKTYGMIGEKEKPEFLAQADIAVFPSLGGESFGIVLLEAMAARAEVVLGGDNPGYRSVLGPDPDTLINPRKPQEFAEVLAKFCNNRELRKSIHTKQQKIVKKYGINVVGEQILSEYQRLAKSSFPRQTKK